MADAAPRAYGIERQLQLYLAGMQGQKPEQPVAIEELKGLARERLSPEAYGYVAGGAGGEATMQANREAFQRWRIVPRMLRNVEQRDLGVELLGARLPAPLLLAPVGGQSIVHPEADLARPGLPARAHDAADPAERHPASRRRRQGAGRRHGWPDRLEPRRPAGGWRDRLAGCAARRAGAGQRPRAGAAG